MEQMVAESQAIIIAKRIDHADSTSYKENQAYIEIEVVEVLKPDGSLQVGDEIEVQSWYGICPYGLQMNRYENAVVFLNKQSEGSWFSSPKYESATYKHALCNDDAMRLKKQSLIIWDPLKRLEVKYPMTEFRRVFLNKYPQAKKPE